VQLLMAEQVAEICPGHPLTGTNKMTRMSRAKTTLYPKTEKKACPPLRLHFPQPQEYSRTLRRQQRRVATSWARARSWWPYWQNKRQILLSVPHLLSTQ